MSKATDRRLGKFFIIENRIFNYELTPYEFTVYAAIVLHVNQETDCAWPSMARLEKITGISKPTIIKSIARLEELKLITVERDYNPETKQYHVNHYYLEGEFEGGSKADLLGVVNQIDKGVVKQVYHNNTILEQYDIEQDLDACASMPTPQDTSETFPTSGNFEPDELPDSAHKEDCLSPLDLESAAAENFDAALDAAAPDMPDAPKTRKPSAHQLRIGILCRMIAHNKGIDYATLDTTAQASYNSAFSGQAANLWKQLKLAHEVKEITPDELQAFYDDYLSTGLAFPTSENKLAVHFGTWRIQGSEVWKREFNKARGTNGGDKVKRLPDGAPALRYCHTTDEQRRISGHHDISYQFSDVPLRKRKSTENKEE